MLVRMLPPPLHCLEPFTELFVVMPHLFRWRIVFRQLQHAEHTKRGRQCVTQVEGASLGVASWEETVDSASATFNCSDESEELVGAAEFPALTAGT